MNGRPLVKEASQLRQMEKHLFQKFSGPYVILAVHLCGGVVYSLIGWFISLEWKK